MTTTQAYSHQRTIITRIAPVISAICLSILLSSCASTPSSPSVDYSDDPRAQLKLINAAQSIDEQLSTLALLISQNEYELALKLSDSIDRSQLHGEQLGIWTLYQSQLALAQNRAEDAINLLFDPVLLNELDLLDNALQIDLIIERARALNQAQKPIAAARERIYIAPQISHTDRQDTNRHAIWKTLNSADSEQLQTAIKTDSKTDFQGWLALTQISRSEHHDIDSQTEQLKLWFQQWPEHPAADQPPQEIQLILNIADSRPQQVAILLPLQGRYERAGQAILDGFLNAYYRQDKSKYAPTISVYDTSNIEDFSQLYDSVVAGGAELIVGPLNKKHVRELYDMADLAVPTLALSYVSDYGENPNALYEFGLAIEDESRQIAEIARFKKQKRIVILAPNKGWGKRASKAFAESWNQDQEAVIASQLYDDTRASRVIKKAFAIDQSHQRNARIAAATGLNLQFEPRRRQDIDAIYLLALPKQARTIKPMFAFHYGADIPVYSSSQVHAGISSRQREPDLNGIEFIDIPWLINKPDSALNELKPQLHQNPFVRMYALGLDSYQLFQRLPLLQQFPDTHFYGRSGDISIQHNKLSRRLSRASFKSSRVKAMPAINPELDTTASTSP